MRRPLLALLFILAGALLGMPFVAEADHINEPKAPVTGLRLHLENYATGEDVDCSGGVPYPYSKVRVGMYVTADVGETGNPSEHFTAGYRMFWQDLSAKGQLVWRGADDPSWPHQNMPPHATNGKFDASRLSDVNGLLLPRPGATGRWKVEATIKGDESGTVLTDSCIFRVE